MFSFSFKESQEREARKVDVFDFGKWFDASCKGNKIYHRGLLRAWSENIACLWQRIALKTASAWSVWNPCLTVSITKTLMFLFLLEKDFIYFEINPRLPKCTVCFQAQRTRAVHQGHIAEGSGECSFFGSWARLAKESAWDQPHGSRGTLRTWNVGTFGQHSCTAVQGHGSSPAPGARGILHRWCCAALGHCRAALGWRDLSVNKWNPTDLHFPGGTSGLHVEGRTLGPVLGMKAE